MRKKITLALILVIAAILLGFPVWAGGGQAGGGSAAAKPLVKVNIAIHANGGGASAIASTLDGNYFTEYGIDPQITIVESGPVEMAAMRADNPALDIGYIGAGVAWNPIDSSGNSLSFIFFDNLGNSERLLAKKGIFRANSSGKFDYPSLYAGLRGKTVYTEVGTTAGGWLKNLLAAINGGYAAGDQLWIHCEDAAFLTGYTAPNSKPENRVFVVNYPIVNIPAGMATAGANTVDIAAAYEPIPSTVLRTNSNVEQVADIDSLPRDKVFPSTFVARTKWLKDNPETAKNFIYAVYKGMLRRSLDPNASMRASEKLCAKPDGSFVADAYYFPTAANFQEWFASPQSQGYAYLRSLYNERVPSIPQGVTPKPFEQAFDLAIFLQAIKEIK